MRVPVVVDLFAEGVREASEPAHRHAHGKVLALYKGRAYMVRIGHTANGLHVAAEARCWAVARLWTVANSAENLMPKILWFNEYLHRIWAEALQIAESLGLPERAAGAIADGIMGRKIKNATYRGYSNISENVASRALKMLMDVKLLIAKGDKRGRHYEPSGILEEAQRRIFKPFKIPDRSKAPMDDLPEQQKLSGFQRSLVVSLTIRAAN